MYISLVCKEKKVGEIVTEIQIIIKIKKKIGAKPF